MQGSVSYAPGQRCWILQLRVVLQLSVLSQEPIRIWFCESHTGTQTQYNQYIQSISYKVHLETDLTKTFQGIWKTIRFIGVGFAPFSAPLIHQSQFSPLALASLILYIHKHILLWKGFPDTVRWYHHCLNSYHLIGTQNLPRIIHFYIHL